MQKITITQEHNRILTSENNKLKLSKLLAVITIDEQDQTESFKNYLYGMNSDKDSIKGLSLLLIFEKPIEENNSAKNTWMITQPYNLENYIYYLELRDKYFVLEFE